MQYEEEKYFNTESWNDLYLNINMRASLDE